MAGVIFSFKFYGVREIIGVGKNHINTPFINFNEMK